MDYGKKHVIGILVIFLAICVAWVGFCGTVYYGMGASLGTTVSLAIGGIGIIAAIGALFWAET